MGRDYSGMLDAAAELQDYQGYLDTEGLNQRAEVQAKLISARNRFVYELLREEGDWRALYQSVVADLDEIEAASDPAWQGPIAEVRETLLPRIEQEAGRSPWLRTMIRWTPIALGVAVLCAYFGVRLLSAVEISQPIESRAGLEQRAEAARKAIRYDDWASDRSARRKWVGDILLWPIEPTEAELRGAQEFVSLTLEAHDSLRAQGLPCRYLLLNIDDRLDDAQLALVAAVADHFRNEKLQWRDPPVMTVLDPVRRHLRC